MGYEVKYNFYKMENGEYNKSEKHEALIKVGSPYEEVPLNALAGKVMALLARRNILVVDVEIFELVKKPLSYKEMEDGIVIKNRKFRFDDGPAVEGEEVKDESSDQEKLLELLKKPEVLAVLKANNKSAPQTTQAIQPAKPASEKPIKIMFFSPDDRYWLDKTRKEIPDLNRAFTAGRRYPIFEQQDRPVGRSPSGEEAIGIYYRTVDNLGRMQWVNDVLFTAEPAGNGLDYGNFTNIPPEMASMPVLRR